MNPFLWLISNIIDLYSLAVVIWIVLGLLIYFKVVNRTHPIVSKIDEVLGKLIEPALRPIRKVLPPIGGVDLSPIVLLLALEFVNRALFYYFYRF